MKTATCHACKLPDVKMRRDGSLTPHPYFGMPNATCYGCPPHVPYEYRPTVDGPVQIRCKRCWQTL